MSYDRPTTRDARAAIIELWSVNRDIWLEDEPDPAAAFRQFLTIHRLSAQSELNIGRRKVAMALAKLDVLEGWLARENLDVTQVTQSAT